MIFSYCALKPGLKLIAEKLGYEFTELPLDIILKLDGHFLNEDYVKIQLTYIDYMKHHSPFAYGDLTTA